jgi:predicted trehalose synthase
MQLTYRGIAYEFVPSPTTVQERVVPCQYRGLEWNWQAPSAAMTLSEAFALVYRGIALNPAAIAAFGIPVAEVAPSTVASSRKHFLAMIEETHRQNLMHRLQERIRSAQARGDEHLLQQLEHERQLLA